MPLKLGRTIYLGRLAQSLTIGLIVFCGDLLTAGADDQDTKTTEGPSATTAVGVAPVTSQPTLKATRPEPTPNSFSPGGQDVPQVADADLVFTVGLNLEAEWLYDPLRNTKADESKLIAFGEFVDPLEFFGPDPHGYHGDDHGETIAVDGHEGPPVMGRLLIGDGEEGKVSVIDLETGEVDQDRFNLGSRAGRIYSTRNGRYAIAFSPDANAAHLFDRGILMEPYEDHFDLVEAPTQRLDIDLAGDRPVHLYVGEEWATIFYDGSGDAVLINEHDLEERGSDYVPPRFNAVPQHGAVVPLEDDLFAVR